MAVVKFSCNNTLVNGTLHLVINFSQPNGAANSTSFQDSMGAMRFTIAVVLVYGVGVIGLLGISARRNRRLELMDKEVNKFIKSKLSKYEERRAKKPKRTISKLISSLHSIIQNDESEGRKFQVTGGPGSPLCRANTWLGAGNTVDSPCISSKDDRESTHLDSVVIIKNPTSCKNTHSHVADIPSSVTIHNDKVCHSNNNPEDEGCHESQPAPVLMKEYNTAGDDEKITALGTCFKSSHESSKKVVSFKDMATHAVLMDSSITYV